jgi:hypothetical protein
MLIGLKKVSALAGDNFQVIICEGTFIDRYRLIGENGEDRIAP